MFARNHAVASSERANLSDNIASRQTGPALSAIRLDPDLVRNKTFLFWAGFLLTGISSWLPILNDVFLGTYQPLAVTSLSPV